MVENNEAVAALEFLTGKTLWSTTHLFKSMDQAEQPKKQSLGKLGGALLKEMSNNVSQRFPKSRRTLPLRSYYG